MNPQIQDILRQLINVLPALTQGLHGFTAALQPMAATFQAFAGAAAGLIQQAAAAAARTPIGQAVGQFAGTAARAFSQSSVGQFAARAAGAAAGVGRAALGAVAAVGASPLGQVTVAAAGVAAALVGLGVATERLGRQFLESQRHLAESSAAMAAVMAGSDIRRTFREMKAGDEQAGTARFLATGLDRLADTLQPITTLLSNLLNIVGGVMARVLDLLLKPLSKIAEFLNKIIEKLFGPDNKEGDPLILSQWMGQVLADGEKARRRRLAFP